MRHLPSISPSAARLLVTRLLLAAAAFAVIPTLVAQQPVSSFASSSSPATDTATPTWHETTITADKKINTRVTEGVLTVDGLVAKVQLNYDIRDAGYLYIFVPGVGTAVVSRVNTYGAERVKNALHGKTLAFSAGGHSFELTSATPMSEGKEPKAAKQTQEAKAPKASKPGKPGKQDAEVKEVKDGPGDLYVRLDTAALNLDRYPCSASATPPAPPTAGPSPARPPRTPQLTSSPRRPCQPASSPAP